jgi:hypothetical protein
MITGIMARMQMGNTNHRSEEQLHLHRAALIDASGTEYFRIQQRPPNSQRVALESGTGEPMETIGQTGANWLFRHIEAVFEPHI